MNWKAMQRLLPQVAEVTRIFGGTLADKIEVRNPKLAPIVRGGLKAIETFADEAGSSDPASPQAPGGQYLPQRPPYPQQDPVFDELLTEQYDLEQLAARGGPESYRPPYGEGGGDQER